LYEKPEQPRDADKPSHNNKYELRNT